VTVSIHLRSDDTNVIKFAEVLNLQKYSYPATIKHDDKILNLKSKYTKGITFTRSSNPQNRCYFIEKM